MTDDDVLTVVCAEAVLGQEFVVRGSKIAQCAACTTPIWIAPAGQEMLASTQFRRTRAVCLACSAIESARTGETPIVTRKAVEEARRALEEGPAHG